MANPDAALVHGLLDGTLSLPLSCNSSPIAVALGMTITGLSPDCGTAHLEFMPQETFLQGAGVLQGGAVAAMLDFAMIISVMAVIPRDDAPAAAHLATTNLDVTFLRAAPPGRFLAEARILRRTRSVVFAQASLRLPDGTDVAVASATNMIRAPRI